MGRRLPRFHGRARDRLLGARRRLDAAATYRALVHRHFKGSLKPPFNHAARAAAGLPATFYEPLAAL